MPSMVGWCHNPTERGAFVALFIIIGSIFSALAVASGAFGAHFVEQLVDPSMFYVYQTAVHYHMWHGVALILFGLCGVSCGWQTKWPGYLFCAGILLFSGSLYLYAFFPLRTLVMVTPLGGICFLLGWGGMAWVALKER